VRCGAVGLRMGRADAGAVAACGALRDARAGDRAGAGVAPDAGPCARRCAHAGHNAGRMAGTGCVHRGKRSRSVCSAVRGDRVRNVTGGVARRCLAPGLPGRAAGSASRSGYQGPLRSGGAVGASPPTPSRRAWALRDARPEIAPEAALRRTQDLLATLRAREAQRMMAGTGPESIAASSVARRAGRARRDRVR
jgi:hypothetical protein